MNLSPTRSLLTTIASVFWLLGIASCITSATPIHSVTGAILILTGTVSLVGLAIVNTLIAVTRKQGQQTEP